MEYIKSSRQFSIWATLFRRAARPGVGFPVRVTPQDGHIPGSAVRWLPRTAANPLAPAA